VAITAVLGGIVVTGVATAQQSGQIGDVIRVVNADSRRVLRARITGKGSAEVLHGS
jgi:flagella basal body P-ring formation protein FlgA